MMEMYIRQMIESASRMSLETLRVQHELKVAALSQQIRSLESQLEFLQANQG